MWIIGAFVFGVIVGRAIYAWGYFRGRKDGRIVAAALRRSRR